MIQQVLDKFNLSVGAGECVAVVGPSGGGKSTSISLLQRFYDVTEGQVFPKHLFKRWSTYNYKV